MERNLFWNKYLMTDAFDQSWEQFVDRLCHSHFFLIFFHSDNIRSYISQYGEWLARTLGKDFFITNIGIQKCKRMFTFVTSELEHVAFFKDIALKHTIFSLALPYVASHS